MKAIIRTKAGKDLSTMKVENITSPTPKSGEVKIKMASSRINPVDVDLMKGMPFLKYKNPQIGGIDGAGTIIEIGQNVDNFQVGDDVFFYRKFTDIGTWAEEITIKTNDIAKIPNGISAKDAGSFALPLLTGFEMLEELNPKAGEKVLIHGAAGGVGFQAVQAAKVKGLEVYATANDKQFDILKKAGVSKLINYKTQQFENEIARKEVDYIIDVLGGDVLLKSIALQPKKVISVQYIEPSKMSKTGIQFPSILNWIMKLSMRKFRKTAEKNKVKLIGQVTGANGLLLQKTTDMMNKTNYIVNDYRKITLSEIEQNGLSKKDFGKVILF